MKERIMKAILATLLIITLTMANFILLGFNVVTYAVDSLTQEKETNHKNVEFMAYFKNAKGEILSNQEVKMNATDLKMYFKIGVKQEGYFNGQVTISNANFKIDETTLQNKDISKVEGNVIYFNQIGAGEEKEFEVGITLIKDDAYTLEMLEQNVEVSISGIYKDSTQKNIAIKAKRELSLKLLDSYSDNKESPVLLKQNVITNNVYAKDGKNVRIVQMQIEAGLLDNAYPVKNSKVEITAPKMKDAYPKTVEVVTPEVLMTNGKKLDNAQYQYDAKTGKLTIEVENPEEDGKVSWQKTGIDKYIITYVFEGEEKIETQTITTNVDYYLYDAKKSRYSMEIQTTMSSDELDSTVELKTDSIDTEIYKGKLYAGIDREFVQNIHVQVNISGIAENIYLSEDFAQMNLQIYTKQVQISKENMKSILGQEGKITILEKVTNNVLAEINKENVTDENGNIIVNIPENIKEIAIETTKPEKEGLLDITTRKVIKGNSINTVKNANEMKYVVTGKYMIGSMENVINDAETKIALKESETTARLEVSKEELSTMTTNKNVEMKVILQSSSESQELYKAPTIKVTLPDKIQSIEINSVKLLYEDELQIKSYELKGKTIEIQLENEQTQYKDSALEGAVILISANLTTNKKERNSTEQIRLTYTNQKAINYKDGAEIGQEAKEVKITSYAGIVTVNTIEDYGIETINNEGTKQGKLQLGTEIKTTTVKSEVFNNQENKVSNVKILGTFPTSGAINENNILTNVSEVRVSGIDTERIKIYYTEKQDADSQVDKKENGWSEQIENSSKVKKYLISIEHLDVSEDLYFEYDITIPENLEYNQISKQGYDIYYTVDNTGVEQTVSLDKITLETGRGPVAEATLKATVGGKEATKAKKGEFICYTITAKNTGTEPVTAVKLIGQVPTGTEYIEEVPPSEEMTVEEREDKRFEEFPDKKQVEFVVDKIEPGKEIVKTYNVKVKEITAQIVQNKIQVQYGEVKKESNTVETKLEDGNMEISLYSADDRGIVDAGYVYRYVIQVTNNSNKKMKNIKVNLQTENMEVKQMFYYREDSEDVKVEDANDIVIKEISSGESIDVAAYAEVNQFTDSETRPVVLQAKALNDDVEYCSNQKILTANAALLEMTHTSENSGEYVKSGDEITYKIKVTNQGQNAIDNVKITDIISKYETLVSITSGGNVLSEEEFAKEVNPDGTGITISIDTNLQGAESKEYLVKTTVNKIPGNTETIVFTNVSKAYAYSIETATQEVKHILEPEQTEETSSNDSSNGNTSTGENKEEGNTTTATKIISGVAWLDKNENGEKDSKDTLLEGITVKLLNVATNTCLTDEEGKVIQTKTDSKGFYSLTGIPQGKYMVIFEYDTSKYGLVEYEKQNVSEENNSNVISKEITIDGSSKTVGCTDSINIEDKNIANINIGLKELKVFDMKLEKYVSRIVVNNAEGVSTYEYGEAKLAKAEIHAKQINQTNVVVEYKIKVTNEGEIPGYVKKIEDKIASDYKFSSELNKDWYQSGNIVTNVSLANTRIEPGESKEITLILTKQMTENNTGLINNTAEITESYNEQGIQDKDSIPGNQVITEDDMGSADAILSIKTGEIVMTVVIIITSIIILSVGAYIIARMVLRRKVL